MTRNQHDMQLDHFGVGLDTQIVIDGDIGSFLSGTGLHEVLEALNSGGGGGVGDLYLENDDSSLSAPAVVFKDDVDTLAAQDSTTTAYAALILTTGGAGTAEVYGQTSSGAVYADIWADGSTGRVELYSTHGMLMPTLSSDPSSPANGQMYYNDSTHKLRLRANGAWVDLN
jgi:hypothetical protein